MRLLLAIAICVLSAATSNAASRAEFDQLVQQVQAKPGDNALREGVIKMAQELKPAPAIPEEARRSFVQGNTFAKSAKDASGQKLAIDAYNDALKLAPWWGEAYYNLALAQELAGRYSAARVSLKLYLLTKPSEQEARQATDHIYELEAKERLAKAPESKPVAPPRRTTTEPHTTAPTPTPSPVEAASQRWNARWKFTTFNSEFGGGAPMELQSSQNGSVIEFPNPGLTLRGTISASGNITWELIRLGCGSTPVSVTVSPDYNTLQFSANTQDASSCGYYSDVNTFTLTRQ